MGAQYEALGYAHYETTTITFIFQDRPFTGWVGPYVLECMLDISPLINECDFRVCGEKH